VSSAPAIPNAAHPLFVEEAGREGAPPMVLVHGFGASNHSWRKWVPEFGRDYRLHMVELMGFGRAEAPRHGDYTPLAQGRHLARYLERIAGAGPPVLVGHSLGAAVILAAALEGPGGVGDEPAPPRPRALVVVSGAVFPLAFPRYMSLARRPLVGELLLLFQPPRWGLRMGLRDIVHDASTVDASQVSGYQAPLASLERRLGVLRAARQLRPEEDAARLVPRYGTLDAPLLALWGAEDPVIPPAFAERLARAVPDGQAVILPGVGHLPPEEAPKVSAAAVRTFLARI
jgi:pimeloyl-ACP methyl ester carboxylesterase